MPEMDCPADTLLTAALLHRDKRRTVREMLVFLQQDTEILSPPVLEFERHCYSVDSFNGPKRARQSDDTETSSKRLRTNKITNGTQLIVADDALNSSSRDPETPPSSPCSDTFDKDEIDLRPLIEPESPNFADVIQKLLELRDIAGDAAKAERMCQ